MNTTQDTATDDVQIVSYEEARDAYAEFVREMRLGFHDPMSFKDFLRDNGLKVHGAK